MGTDPEPDDCIGFPDAQCTVIPADANRIYGVERIYQFEPQAGMMGIVLKESVRIPGLALHLLR
jgi:hypothetical protein